MGKSTGINSAVSGKIGDVVYYYRNGKQVRRIYVKNPANPRTKGQTDQRLKFALAGRISKIVPYMAIEGLSGSRIQRRGRFMQFIIRGTTIADGVARISFPDILFSEGTQPVLTGNHQLLSAATVGNRRNAIMRTSLDNGVTLPANYGERYVLLFLNQSTSAFDYAVTGLLNLPTTTDPVDTNISLTTADKTSTYTVVMYVCPFLAVPPEGRSMKTSYIGTQDGTVIIDLLTGETVSGRLLYGQSVQVNVTELIPQPSQTTSSAKRKSD